MDSFSPVSFMSVFYGFLKLINFPPFVRNSWHWRRETLPTGCMSKLSCSQSRLSGGTARLPPAPLPCSSGRPVSARGGAYDPYDPCYHDASPTAWQASYGPRQPFPGLSLHPEPCSGWEGARDVCCAAPGRPPPAPSSNAGHR